MGVVQSGWRSDRRKAQAIEFPLTAGIVGVVVAPVVAAIGVLIAMMKDCTIQIERVEALSAWPTDVMARTGRVS